MAVTWPLTINPPLNILFAEPSLILGVMLIAASIFLGEQKDAVNALASSNKKIADEADLYGLPAIGALLMPFAVRKPHTKLPTIVGYSWVIAGVIFLLFSAMNYYTHSGMLINMLRGTSFTF
jgi:hypothetical protein